MKDTEAAKKQLNERIRRSARFAVLVMREEDKAVVRKYFDTPLLFSVQEAKGLEYENIVLVNFVSENEKIFRDVAEGIAPQDLEGELHYARAGREDKSLESYKFFINSLYVAITRAMRNLYVIESREKNELLALLGLTQFREKVDMQVQQSTDEEWRQEARKLELQGKTEQAEAIRKGVLAQKEPNWEVLRPENLPVLRQQALSTDHYHKKAKDRLFEYALLYDDLTTIGQLAAMEGKHRYNRVHSPLEGERKNLQRRQYAAFVMDNVKEVASRVKLYGTDYRDEYNFTPLMGAALLGATKSVDWLIENGADKTRIDTLGRTPLQLALVQVLRSPASMTGKLGGLYEALRTDSLSLRLGDHLVKVDAHKAEYPVINYLLVAQMTLIRTKWQEHGFPFPRYVEAEDIEHFLKQFPASVVPDFRKDRKYINALMARNEVQSKQPYNLRLWIRLRNGNYVLNPDLQVLAGGEWINVYQLMNALPDELTNDRFTALFWQRVDFLSKAAQRKTAKP